MLEAYRVCRSELGFSRFWSCVFAPIVERELWVEKQR
jgi:hypothetical protein